MIPVWILYYYTCICVIMFCTAVTGANPTGASGAEIRVNVEVVKRLQDLKRCFSSMLTNIRRLYADCDLAEMQFFLHDLLDAEEFKKCATIDDILEQLRQGHVDTFNIHCLEQLAAHFQRHEVDEMIDEYNRKKNKFLTETVITEFHQAVASRVVPVLPGGKASVTIKIPRKLASRRTLKDMEELAGKAFGDYYESFVNLDVVAGSIIILWFFPKRFTNKLEEQAQTNKFIFKQEGVEEVTVAGYVVFLRSSEVGTHTCMYAWMIFCYCLFVCRCKYYMWIGTHRVSLRKI